MLRQLATKTRAIYRGHFLAIEFVFALAAFLALVTWDGLIHPGAIGEVLDKNRQAVYATIASIGGSLLGFILTAVSVIIVFGEMPRFRVLRDSGHYETVFAVYFDAILWLTILTIAALFGIVIDTESGPAWWVAYFVALAGLVAFVRVCRCVWILKAMTAIAIKPIPDVYDKGDRHAA